MRKIGKNSIEFENVFLRATSTVAGPKESKGPLGKYFDVHFNDSHCGQENWEQAEIKMQQMAIDLVLEKTGLNIKNIDAI